MRLTFSRTRILSTIVLVGLCSSAVWAQEGPGLSENAQSRANVEVSAHNLTGSSLEFDQAKSGIRGRFLSPGIPKFTTSFH